jgi:protein arginine kinase activator
MICESCKQKVATIHMTEIVDNVKREVHLCEECAAEKGFQVQPHFSINEILGSLMAAQKQAESEGPELTCASCGITYSEFRSKGRFGCANDYSAFKERLIPLLDKIHGTTQHMGKIPPRIDKNLARQGELMVLKEQLDQLVRKEAYEDAVAVRDKIKVLEEELHGGN